MTIPATITPAAKPNKAAGTAGAVRQQTDLSGLATDEPFAHLGQALRVRDAGQRFRQPLRGVHAETRCRHAPQQRPLMRETFLATSREPLLQPLFEPLPEPFLDSLSNPLVRPLSGPLVQHRPRVADQLDDPKGEGRSQYP